MYVITRGFAYTDIDVLACACAYHQCLLLQGIDSRVILRAPFNETIPQSVRKWNFRIDSQAPQFPELYHYILVDVSDPSFFEKFVVIDHVKEVLDHHFGFEDYWKKRLGQKGVVDHVGSCATLVWERFKQFGCEELIGRVEANLLYTAIFSNTLNLQAEVTTQRDRVAFKELEKFTQLPKQWMFKYYREVGQKIIADPIAAMKKDTKTLKLQQTDLTIAQIELWDANLFLAFLEKTKKLGVSLLLLSEISTKTTYFVCKDLEVQSWIARITGASFSNHIASLNRFWMRKEIIRELQTHCHLSLPV